MCAYQKSIHSNSYPIEPVLVWSVLWSLDTPEQDDQSAGLDSSSPAHCLERLLHLIKTFSNDAQHFMSLFQFVVDVSMMNYSAYRPLFAGSGLTPCFRHRFAIHDRHCVLRRGLRGACIRFKTQRPFDSAQNVRFMRLADLSGIFPVGNVGVSIPDVFTMAERGVENPARAVMLAPRNGEMPGRIGFRMFVE